MTINLNLRRSASIAALALLIGACSSTSTGSSSSTAASDDSTTTAADSTPDTADTSSTSTSTTAAAPIEFTLHGEGIGPFNFGGPAGDIINALTEEFGVPISVETVEYPTSDGFGGYETVDGDFGFEVPVGRTMCWTFHLCLQFGGEEIEPTTQTFMGWTYGEQSATTFVSTSGVTIGSRWSDFPAMSVDPGGCYTVGSGTIDGIDLTLQSSDVAFGEFDDLGNYVENVPPADQVTVVFMQAGANPISLFGDC